MLGMGPFGYPADYLLWWLLFLSLLLHTWCFFRFFPRPRRRLRLLLGNSLIFFCLAGCAGLLAESYIRFLSVQTESFGLSLPARRWFALYVKLNSLGCRDVEWSMEKPPDVRRIAFVGDSFTYGWGIERVEERFTDRIQSEFGHRAPGRVQVMNVAKPGWDTGAQLAPIQDLIDRFAIDEVVLCYVCNDIEKVLPVSGDFNPTRPPEPRWFNPESSCLIDSLYWTFYVPRCPTVRGYHDWLADGFANEATWRRHQEQLAAIIELCKDRGVTMRATLLPFLRVGGTKFDTRRIHGAVRTFFEVNGVRVVDLRPAVEGERPERWVVSSRDGHPNAEAHDRFAKAIWDSLYAQPRN